MKATGQDQYIKLATYQALAGKFRRLTRPPLRVLPFYYSQGCKSHIRGSIAKRFMMASVSMNKSADKSYLSSAVESLNPWSTAATKRPSPPPLQNDHDKSVATSPTTLTPAFPEDHITSHLYGRSVGQYPLDCPPLKAQWFHAVDVIKRKPQMSKSIQKPPSDAKPTVQAKKYSPFSVSDSNAIECQYQKLLEAAEVESSTATGSNSHKRSASAASTTDQEHHVPVNEDFLFNVNIEKRELEPAYWLGPIYEVRRGTWFYQEGSALKPCEENLAAQLEEGYLKTKPWLSVSSGSNCSQSAMKKTPPRGFEDNTREPTTARYDAPTVAPSTIATEEGHQASTHPQSYRLFGTFMNNVATYQDEHTAWLSSDGMLSWVTSSVYERFSGGGYMSGVKMVRGYREVVNNKDKAKEDASSSGPSETHPVSTLDKDQLKVLDEKSNIATGDGKGTKTTNLSRDKITMNSDNPKSRLQGQLSMMSFGFGTEADATKQLCEQEEEEIVEDYNAQAGEVQGREIEHLILVTHGIGQQLGIRKESVNFVHDVNVLRKTLKSVYASSADLRALNSELDLGPGNCRVQVLPVCWRHLLDFPKEREKRQEHDLGDASEDEDIYPSLQDITVEGVAYARSLMSDFALDVLLYQSSYREQICRIVVQECNRIHALFKERNPMFQGKVHLVGHSLGSAVLFDILCREPERDITRERSDLFRIWSTCNRSSKIQSTDSESELNFDVEDLYCLGSPIGLFQMLEGRTIAGRRLPDDLPLQRPPGHKNSENIFESAVPSNQAKPPSASGLPFSVSSPKVEQLFNIFHPSDPIAYRLEPLVTPAMTRIKPQGLPYTKKGILDTANQGLSGIGTKVGQSVSGMWSNFSAGITNGIINRRLGLSNEEATQITKQHQQSQMQTIETEEEVLSNAVRKGEETDERKKELATTTMTKQHNDGNGKGPALIDDELETLFSQFQKQHDHHDEGSGKPPQSIEKQRQAWKVKTEDVKMKALNRNGRVDYSIQESVLDFNPINTISSHLAYWADVDVNHFILSQLLSSKPRAKPPAKE